MRAIYEPTGRAREYAALACNLYRGCGHRCKYCYAPGVARYKREEWHTRLELRPGIIDALRRDADRLAARGEHREILFCFTSDPYCLQIKDHTPTRDALEIVGSRGLKFIVLTKAGMAAITDFDLLMKYGGRFGTSLVWDSDALRREWEPGAASIDDRNEAITTARLKWGISTWLSVEPVIDPAQALQVIRRYRNVVDEIKVGKLNHMPDIEACVDWRKFLIDATRELKQGTASWRIKRDLAAYENK